MLLQRTPSFREFAVVVVALATSACSCEGDPPPGASPVDSARAAVGSPVVPPELSGQPADPPPDAGGAEYDAGPPPPWSGPFLGITRSSAGFYASMEFDRETKIGYTQSGGRVPVYAGAIERENCKGGWYRLAAGGYVCGSYGSTDLESPAVRFARKQPNLEEVLPYTYARNAKNGTPLYKSVPTPEQMHEYEPYLPGAKKTKKKAERDEAKDEPTRPASLEKVERRTTRKRKAERDDDDSAELDEDDTSSKAEESDVTLAGDGGAPDKTPWWQDESVDDRLHEVRLSDLAAEEDDLIAKRMVKGFYVAVDKQFSWNGRPWYKTTKGLIAPADRFWTTKGSSFQGVELKGDVQLPVGWSYGWRKHRPTYTLSDDDKTMKLSKQLERFDWVNLSGKEIEVGGKTYVESVDGFWVRKSHLRITNPGPPPVDLGPRERWVDVNLTTQTVVAFLGTRPVYATLISSGKEHRKKEKDHRTPSGEWRIREKHVTATMDGDGSAAGDLPYSIEDVPYVMYFYKAYALHGAFWHQNYGSQMSHGCVNLAPLDAKWLFFFTAPAVPEGWHGAWSSEENPGSRVVVHE